MDAAEFDEFERLVNSTESHTETQCATFLHHAAGLLIPQTPLHRNFAREDRNFFGSTDFIISATIKTDQNHEEQVAYIWS